MLQMRIYCDWNCPVQEAKCSQMNDQKEGTDRPDNEWRKGGFNECSILRIAMATEKTFYLETFGCQMNAHDSEKVIGTLQHEGYRQVETEEEAGLILYNTCSIRDKAEQKVFNRLN